MGSGFITGVVGLRAGAARSAAESGLTIGGGRTMPRAMRAAFNPRLVLSTRFSGVGRELD